MLFSITRPPANCRPLWANAAIPGQKKKQRLPATAAEVYHHSLSNIVLYGTSKQNTGCEF